MTCTLTAFFSLLLLYSFLRAGFYVFNTDFFIGISTAEILEAFVRGIRFDIAALLLLNIPVLLLVLMPGPQFRWKPYRAGVFVLFLLLNGIAILLNIADYAYFPMVQRRLMYEPYTMVPDVLRALPGMIAGHLALVLLGCAVLVSLLAGMRKLLRSVDMLAAGRNGYLLDSIWFFLAIALVIIGIRGGLQLKPLRQTNAFSGAGPAAGYLALNSTYTVVRSLFQPTLQEYRFLPEAEAHRLVRELIQQEDERMEDPAYPFLRERIPTHSFRKLNVVVFILESWTAKYSGSISRRKTFTPLFDSLAAGGILLTNFLANGQRSIEGVPSVLTSVPGLYPASLIGSKAEMNSYRGLGTILQEQGYMTSFHHGARTGSMGFDAFARVSGYQHYFGQEDYSDLRDDDLNGSWGINDEPFFLDAVQRLNSFPQPFCSVIVSLSSHDPYHIPSYRKALFERFSDETDFERSMRYADFSLGRFFRAARAQPWFDSTVFIITADHTNFSDRNNLHSAFHIPTLIYAPSVLKPKVDGRVASHVDLLPSILDLLGIRARHASMGRSVFDSLRYPFAVTRYGEEFCLFTESRVLVFDTESFPRLYDYHHDPLRRSDLRLVEPRRTDTLRKLLMGYVQSVSSSLANDRVSKR